MSTMLDQNRIMQRVHDEPNSFLRTSNIAQFVSIPFDTVIKTNASSVQEVFSYKQGGLAGTLVATLTITYTDSTKSDIASVVRT